MIAIEESQVNHEAPSAEWLVLLRSMQDRILRDITYFSDLYNISALDLKLRVLLHLPRYKAKELENHELVYAEIERLAKMMLELQWEFRGWTHQKSIGGLDKTKAYVCEVPEDIATIIHERFHYIGSRRSGRHFALHFTGRQMPAAVATLSEMDVQKLKSHLPLPSAKRPLLLSRMFSFRWAPRNSISYLLGKMDHCLKKEGQVNSLVTWVNPNLGFSASSYRAANWIYAGCEPTSYRYIKGNYLTARQAHEEARAPAIKIETSHLRLAPLQVWYHPVKP